RRGAPGYRQARPCHEGKSHAPRRVVHLARPVPIPRQVLVVEDRHRAAAGPEYFHDFLEEGVPRILGLAFFVTRILPMLADEDHAVDRELATPELKFLRDTRQPV